MLLGDRATKLNRFQVPVPGAPDIAVEVISPSERTTESLRKVDRYLALGVREVWQIHPNAPRQVMVHTQDTVRKVSREAMLETGLLPGFVLSISALFQP
ncbi:MAG: Uma2 family endonuclease [Acidobacteriota bacterium]|nr:Uma2 family endonuclease [Acidobacteriota bacterium]